MQVIFAAETALDESLRGKESARLINMYPEKGGSRGPVTIRGVPGLKETTSLGSGRVRAMISASDGLYAAVGGQFVKWDGTTATVLGTIPDGETTLARNRTQIGITAGGKYYVWDGTTVGEVAGAAFSNIGSVAYIDNFIILTQLNGEAYAFSAAGDAKSLAALDFASAETSPDDLVKAVSVGGVLWLLGADSVEAWQNAGLNDNPFRRVQSQRMEKGLRSASEVVLMDNTFIWVSNEGRVYRQTDGVPVRVSTDAVEAAIEASADVTAVAYQVRGHDFFVLRFGGKPAWVYDPATQKWHERSTGAAHRPWEVTATVHHNGVWYAGTETGELCTFEGHQDRGDELRREVRSALLSNGGERFTLNNVDVRTEGTGDLMMRLSSDGQTYGRERIKSFGAKRQDRCTFKALGQFREVSMMLACADNTEFAIHDVNIR